MPHITEELWDVLSLDPASTPEDSTIQFQPPPERLDLEGGVADRVRAVYHTVQSGRNLRAESRVPSNQKSQFVLAASADWVGEELPTITRLLNAEEILLAPEYKAAPGTPVAATALGELHLLLPAGDKEAERERLEKEIAKLQAELRTVNMKLANSSFIDRAPPAVVQEHRKRKADFAEQLAQLTRARDALD